MTIAPRSKSSEVRARIGHPVVDADGHIMEYMPLVEEYVREECVRQNVDGGLIEKSALSNLLASKTVSSSLLGGGNRATRDRVAKDGHRAVPPGWYEASTQEREDWRLTRPVYWLSPTKIT